VLICMAISTEGYTFSPICMVSAWGVSLNRIIRTTALTSIICPSLDFYTIYYTILVSSHKYPPIYSVYFIEI